MAISRWDDAIMLDAASAGMEESAEATPRTYRRKNVSRGPIIGLELNTSCWRSGFAYRAVAQAEKMIWEVCCIPLVYSLLA